MPRVEVQDEELGHQHPLRPPCHCRHPCILLQVKQNRLFWLLLPSFAYELITYLLETRMSHLGASKILAFSKMGLANSPTCQYIEE